jgi:hypothetical protein
MSSSDQEESPGSKPDEKMEQEKQRQVEETPETVENPYFVDATEPSSSTGRKLPTWLDHFNAKDLKKLFKCSLAVWIMTLLIIINPTLKVIGRSAFLGW